MKSGTKICIIFKINKEKFHFNNVPFFGQVDFANQTVFLLTYHLAKRRKFRCSPSIRSLFRAILSGYQWCALMLGLIWQVNFAHLRGKISILISKSQLNQKSDGTFTTSDLKNLYFDSLFNVFTHIWNFHGRGPFSDPSLEEDSKSFLVLYWTNNELRK